MTTPEPAGRAGPLIAASDKVVIDSCEWDKLTQRITDLELIMIDLLAWKAEQS